MITPQELQRLLELLDVTHTDEIDCTEFLHRVAGYVERLEASGKLPPGYEDVAQHLEVCPECNEELEALYRALRG
ncbi:MAG: hypothetical protein RL885_10660 [Planctomycetota bacterium]